MNLFSQKPKSESDPYNTDAPAFTPAPEKKADTLRLIPVQGIAGPFVVLRDGSFVYMLEVPPLDNSVGDVDPVAVWGNRYNAALAALPPGTRFQMVVQMEPHDPKSDMQYFLERAKTWVDAESDTTQALSERELRGVKNMSYAAENMVATLASWFDSVRPMRMRMIIVLNFQMGTGVVKNAVFGKSAAAEINMDAVRAALPRATEQISRQASVLITAFESAGIPLRELPPAEMALVFWRAFHLAASGDPKYSAADMAMAMASGNTLTHMEPPALSEFSEQMYPEDIQSLLAPNTVVEREDCVEVDGVLAAGYVIHDFRPNSPVFLNRLNTLPGGWTGTVYYEVEDPAVTAQRLRDREVQLSAQRIARDRKSMISNFGSDQENAAVQMTRYELETTGQSPISVRMFVMRTATDEKTLKERSRSLESLLTTIGVRYYPARYNQLLLWLQLAPTGRHTMNQKPRNMNAAALSTFFWAERKRMHDANGMYIGIDDGTQLPVFMDPFGSRADRTPTTLLLGRPGAGKSVTLRTMMASALISGANVIAVDLEGEMKKFCDEYGGRYIEVGSTSGERINILDIPPDSEDPLIAGTEHLVSFFEAITGRSLPPGQEWNALSEAYRFAMQDRGWLDEDGRVTAIEMRHEDAPRLSDIGRILERQNNTVGPSLAEMLRPYSQGIYAQYFNTPTTFDIRKERLVVFGLQRVNAQESSDRLRVYLWQVMGLIWGEIIRRNSENPEMANHVMMDEVWALLTMPGSARAIENMARRFRKRRAALWLATQQTSEFLNSGEGNRIISIVGNTYIMEQRPMEARRIQAVLELSDGITAQMTKLGVGHGFLVTPNGILQLFIAVPTSWHAIN
jgi:Type IV secretory pathway, VirB4 components